MRTTRGFWAVLAPGLALAACGDEVPTGIGGPLVPPGVQTFEVVLDAPVFLVEDTVALGLARPSEAGFVLMARDFEGRLNAHTLVRFGTAPGFISYTDSAGVTRTDTVPRFVGGEATFWVDTSATRVTEPVALRMFQLDEPFDGRSATWEFRIDTTGVREPWTVPGGTPTGVAAEALLPPGEDTVAIALDSAFVARLIEAEDSVRGVLFMAGTDGARVRAFGVDLRLFVRPEARPDTLLMASLAIVSRTFVTDPPQPPPDPGELRVGGLLPVWRSIVTFRERLDTLRVSACPGVANPPPSCFVPLSSLTVNRAAIQFSPLEPALGFLPEDTVYMDTRALITAPNVPLVRAPLGARLNRRAAVIAPGRFAGPDPPRVEVPLTDLLADFFRPPTEDRAQPNRTVALIGSPEGGTFGYVAFAGIAHGARAPRLRLTLTSDRGIQ